MAGIQVGCIVASRMLAFKGEAVMATENAVRMKNDLASGLVSELFHFRVYKPMLGRIARQATCAAIWLAFTVIAWRWFDTGYGFHWLETSDGVGSESRTALALTLRYLAPLLMLGVGFWVGYRIVNYPKFADFLIAVEAEMNKVTWPSQAELVRSSMVVIFLLASLTVVLYLFDVVWTVIFKWIGVR